MVAIYYGIRIPKERQEGTEAAEAGGARGRESRRLDGQSSHLNGLGGAQHILKGPIGSQPSAQLRGQGVQSSASAPGRDCAWQ
jgi:hypothetical protein